VAPWELSARPLFWLAMAEEGMDADALAEAQQRARQPTGQ